MNLHDYPTREIAKPDVLPVDKLLGGVYAHYAQQGNTVALPQPVISAFNDHRFRKKVGSLAYREVAVIAMGEKKIQWVVGHGVTTLEVPFDPYHCDLFIWPRDQFPENGGMVTKVADRLRTREDIGDSVCYGTSKDGALLLPNYNLGRTSSRLAERIGAEIERRYDKIVTAPPAYRWGPRAHIDIRQNTCAVAEYAPDARRILVDIIDQALLEESERQSRQLALSGRV